MIVENKEETLKKANEVSTKILSLIIKETKDFFCDDDPAEQIYLGCHIVGGLLTKMCISLEEYGKIYGIPNLDIKKVKEFINTISDEYIIVKK